MRPPLFKENPANSRLLIKRLASYGEFSHPVDSCNECWCGFGYAVMVADGTGGAVDVDVFFFFVFVSLSPDKTLRYKPWYKLASIFSR